MEQHTNDGGAPSPAYAGPQTLQAPPTMPIPEATPPMGPPVGSAPVKPVKKKFWSMPKVLVAAGIAVLLAGGGGGFIGYSLGKSDAEHQFAQRFQNGRPNGVNGQGRRGPGQGFGQGRNQDQPTAPSTAGAGNP